MGPTAAPFARTGEYALPLPAGWVDRTPLTVVGPPGEDGAAANVVVTSELLCDNLGLGGFANGQAALIAQHADAFEVVSTEHATLGGEQALVRATRWRIGEEEIEQLAAYCVHEGHGVALVCSAPAGSFAEAEPVFRELIAGFRFEDAT